MQQKKTTLVHTAQAVTRTESTHPRKVVTVRHPVDEDKEEEEEEEEKQKREGKRSKGGRSVSSASTTSASSSSSSSSTSPPQQRDPSARASHQLSAQKTKKPMGVESVDSGSVSSRGGTNASAPTGIPSVTLSSQSKSASRSTTTTSTEGSPSFHQRTHAATSSNQNLFLDAEFGRKEETLVTFDGEAASPTGKGSTRQPLPSPNDTEGNAATHLDHAEEPTRDVMYLERLLLEDQVKLQALHAQAMEAERKWRELCAMVPPPLAVVSQKRIVDRLWAQVHATELQWTENKAAQDALLHEKEVRSLQRELVRAQAIRREADAEADAWEQEQRDIQLLVAQLRTFQSSPSVMPRDGEAARARDVAGYRIPPMPTYVPGMCGGLSIAPAQPNRGRLFNDACTFTANEEFWRHLTQYAKDAEAMFEMGLWNPADAVTLQRIPPPKQKEPSSSGEEKTTRSLASMVVTRDFLCDFVFGWDRTYTDRIHILTGRVEEEDDEPAAGTVPRRGGGTSGKARTLAFFLHGRRIATFHAVPQFWLFLKRSYDTCLGLLRHGCDQTTPEDAASKGIPANSTSASSAKEDLTGTGLVFRTVVFRNDAIEDRRGINPVLWCAIVQRWEAYLQAQNCAHASDGSCL